MKTSTKTAKKTVPAKPVATAKKSPSLIKGASLSGGISKTSAPAKKTTPSKKEAAEQKQHDAYAAKVAASKKKLADAHAACATPAKKAAAKIVKAITKNIDKMNDRAKSTRAVGKKAPAKKVAETKKAATPKGAESVRAALVKKHEQEKAKIEAAKLKLAEAESAVKKAPRSLPEQIAATKRVEESRQLLDAVTATMTSLPIDASDAMRLKAGQRLVLSWYEEGSRHAAGVVVAVDQKKGTLVVDKLKKGSPSVKVTMTVAGRAITAGRTEYVLRTPNQAEASTIENLEREAAKMPSTSAFEKGDLVVVTYPKSVESAGAEPGDYAGKVSSGGTSSISVRLTYAEGGGDVVRLKHDVERNKWEDVTSGCAVSAVKPASAEDHDRLLQTPPSKSAANKKKAEPAPEPAKKSSRSTNLNGPVHTLVRDGKTAARLTREGQSVIKTQVRQPNVKPQTVKTHTRMVPKAVQKNAIAHSQGMAALARQGAAKRAAKKVA